MLKNRKKIKNPLKFHQKLKNPLKFRQKIQKSIENSYYQFLIGFLGALAAGVFELGGGVQQFSWGCFVSVVFVAQKPRSPANVQEHLISIISIYNLNLFKFYINYSPKFI